MPFGILDTQYIDFPGNVDVQYITGLQARSGTSFTEILQEIDSRISSFNATIDPLVASLINPTEKVTARTGDPTAFEVTERGEYTLARPQFAKGGGHMLPIRGYDVSLEFTEDGLQAMPEDDIFLNVDSVLLGFRQNHRRQVLFRLFSPAEVKVDKQTTVTSPGFAGSGTGDNVYTGSYPNGQPLEGGFTMYYYADTAGGATAAVEAMLDAALLRWKKVNGNVIPDLIPSDGLLALVKASTKFVESTSSLIRAASGSAEALVDSDTYAGVYDGKLRIRHGLEDISTNHGAMVARSTGISPSNILDWRYDPLKGRNAWLRYRSFFPLDQAVMLQDFGVGVRNRLGAILLYAADGASAYVAPTFSF